MLGKITALPEEFDKVSALLADNGNFSEDNVNACAAAGVDPVIAMGREAHRLQTPEGKKLYALRKQIPEPVFGIIKSALGFRQFLLRGLDRVRGEWRLVTLAWNIQRMFVLAGAN